MPWARLMRGSRSKLNTVTPRSASTRRASADCAGRKKLSSTAPRGTRVAPGHVGGVDPDHQARSLVGGGGVGGDAGAGADVGGVGEGRLGAGPGLDHHLPPGADQLLDHIGDERDPALSWSCLGGDGQFHGGCV